MGEAVRWGNLEIGRPVPLTSVILINTNKIKNKDLQGVVMLGTLLILIIIIYAAAEAQLIKRLHLLRE